MPTITIRIDNHDQPYTVREMRRRLAQVLSKLNGDQTVSFSFNARLENYIPSTAERHNTMPAVLGAPYDLKNAVEMVGDVDSDVYGDVYEMGGLWKFTKGPHC